MEYNGMEIENWDTELVMWHPDVYGKYINIMGGFEINNGEYVVRCEPAQFEGIVDVKKGVRGSLYDFGFHCMN